MWLQLQADVSSSRLRVVSSTQLPALLSADSFTGRPSDVLLLLGAWSALISGSLAASSSSSSSSAPPRLPVVLVSSVDERFEQRPAQLQRKFQRPYYSRNRRDAVEVPLESSGLALSPL